MNYLFRMLAVMLVVTISCVSLCGALASEPGETEDAFSVMRDLLSAFESDPAKGETLSDIDSIVAYCIKLYDYIPEEKVQQVFYEGLPDAAVLLYTLNNTLYGSICSDQSMWNAELFYVYIWSILHSDEPRQYKTRPFLKTTMKSLHKSLSDDIISSAVDLCVDYIAQYEPKVSASGYEMSGALQMDGDDGYTINFQQGFRLFEEGKYKEAIEAYTRSLNYKSNDIYAMFEIVEAYIMLRNYDEARAWLDRVAPFISTDSDRARWFRRQGFIAIEELNFELGYAFYKYSLKFEKNAQATKELEYITSVSPNTKQFMEEEAEAFLNEYGVVLAK